MATQAERRATTRQRLINVARERFAAVGYDDTLTEHIREQAGVSRGAIYHHFASKQAMFEAVFVQVSDEAIDRAQQQGGTQGSSLETLITSCLAWLHEVRRPDVAAILIDQGPQVLGWERARELEGRSSLKLMTQALERATETGEIDVVSVPLAARLINAMLGEAALAGLQRAPSTSHSDIERAVRQIIEGLSPTSKQPSTEPRSDT